MNCTRCRFINPSGARFCNNCGAAIPQANTPPLFTLPAILEKPWFWIAAVGSLVAAIIIIGSVVNMVSGPKPKQPDLKPSDYSAQSATAPAQSTPSDAESLKTAKAMMLGSHGVASLRDIKTNLERIKSSTPEYAEAQKLLKQVVPELAKAEKAEAAAEAPRLRERLADSYIAAMSAANPYLNFIKQKTTKVKGGFALWAVHELFTSSTFSIGNDAHVVQAWMSENRDDLQKANIVRVGVMNTSGYLGSCWFDIK